jgi:hypothetical protein
MRKNEMTRHRGALIIKKKEVARHPGEVDNKEQGFGSSSGGACRTPADRITAARSFDSAGRIARNHEEAIEAANVTTVRHRGPKLVTTWTLKFSSAIRQSGRSFVSPFAHRWRTVKVTVPLWVGVPDNVPAPDNAIPFGRAPLAAFRRLLLGFKAGGALGKDHRMPQWQGRRAAIQMALSSGEVPPIRALPFVILACYQN